MLKFRRRGRLPGIAVVIGGEPIKRFVGVVELPPARQGINNIATLSYRYSLLFDSETLIKEGDGQVKCLSREIR